MSARPVELRRAVSGRIVFSGIAPHPPLLIPEVGGNRIESVADSQRALRDFSSRLIRNKPETVLVISPHSPTNARVFTARGTPTLTGDFRQFDAAVSLTFKNDLVLLQALSRAAPDEGVQFATIEQNAPLDHGALVPLYYIREAGWTGPVVVIGFTFQSVEKHLAFGRAINRAISDAGKQVALIASGDLSHRLSLDGPYDFEPTAHLFDEQIVEAVSSGDSEAIVAIDESLRERAGECGYRSIVIALGANNGNIPDHRVLSYEGPFGVGYMVAILSDERARQMGSHP